MALPFSGIGMKWTFSSPVATADFSKFAGILSAALSQHPLLGFEIAQLEFHHLHWLWSNWSSQSYKISHVPKNEPKILNSWSFSQRQVYWPTVSMQLVTFSVPSVVVLSSAPDRLSLTLLRGHLWEVSVAVTQILSLRSGGMKCCLFFTPRANFQISVTYLRWWILIVYLFGSHSRLLVPWRRRRGLAHLCNPRPWDCIPGRQALSTRWPEEQVKGPQHSAFAGARQALSCRCPCWLPSQAAPLLRLPVSSEVTSSSNCRSSGPVTPQAPRKAACLSVSGGWAPVLFLHRSQYPRGPLLWFQHRLRNTDLQGKV